MLLVLEWYLRNLCTLNDPRGRGRLLERKLQVKWLFACVQLRHGGSMFFRCIALVFCRCIGDMRTPCVDHDILLLIFIIETVNIVIMPGLVI